MSSDEAIQLTNSDASNCKIYAVSKGYWHDPYINFFCSNSQNLEHKPPEISRGYFARVYAIRNTIYKFLENFENGQIINLGAGYDTLYYNLIDRNLKFKKYVEIDFSKIVSSKIRIIRSKKTLSDKIPRPVNNTEEIKPTQQDNEFKVPSLFAKTVCNHPALTSNSEIHVFNYDLISADLRNLNDLELKLKACDIDFKLPTLVIAECVLVYMSDESSHGLLKFLTENFKKLAFLNYEQVNLNDKFGEIMLKNMEIRACKLAGVTACSSIDNQYKRLLSNGFAKENCQLITMTEFYSNKIDEKERKRIESIEFLDEKELLFQLMDHYCVCIAVNTEELKKLFF